MTYHILNDLQEFFDHHSNSLVTQQASHASKMNVTDEVTVQWPDGVKHGVLKLKHENKNINLHCSSAYILRPTSSYNSWQHILFVETNRRFVACSIFWDPTTPKNTTKRHREQHNVYLLKKYCIYEINHICTAVVDESTNMIYCIYTSHHLAAREDVNSINWPRSQCGAS